MGNTLAMDVSFRNTGYIVFCGETDIILDAGVLKTDAKELKKLHKLKTMQNLFGLIKVIKEINVIIGKFDIDNLVAELGSGSQSNTAAKALAFSYSFVAAPIIQHSLDYKIVTPSEVKKYVYKKTSGGKNGIINFFTNYFNVNVYETKKKLLTIQDKEFNLDEYGSKRLKWKINGKFFSKGEIEHISDASVVFLITKK